MRYLIFLSDQKTQQHNFALANFVVETSNRACAAGKASRNVVYSISCVLLKCCYSAFVALSECFACCHLVLLVYNCWYSCTKYSNFDLLVTRRLRGCKITFSSLLELHESAGNWEFSFAPVRRNLCAHCARTCAKDKERECRKMHVVLLA